MPSSPTTNSRILAKQLDPQQLNDLAHQLDSLAHLLLRQMWTAWCEIWFRSRMTPTGGEHKKLKCDP